MRRLLLILTLLSCAWCPVAWGEPLTDGSAVITWTPTADPTILYELRWKHFKSGGLWVPVASGLNSTSGRYIQQWTPLGNTTGDRTGCWDLRATKDGLSSVWMSELTPPTSVCVQIPLTPVAPPVPSGLQVAKATVDEVIITASAKDCTRVTTSTKGTTGTTLKRTVTCVRG